MNRPIVGILLVAQPGNPDGLVGSGPCRFETPCVYRGIRELSPISDIDWDRLEFGRWKILGSRSASYEAALPLLWNGEFIEAAWDHLRRVFWRCHVGSTWASGHDRVESPMLIRVAHMIVGVGLASRAVFLVRDDQDRLEEIEPPEQPKRR